MIAILSSLVKQKETNNMLHTNNATTATALNAILSQTVYGNAQKDSQLLTQCHNYIMCATNATKNKIKVLHKINQTMGLSNNKKYTQKDVVDYIVSCA